MTTSDSGDSRGSTPWVPQAMTPPGTAAPVDDGPPVPSGLPLPPVPSPWGASPPPKPSRGPAGEATPRRDPWASLRNATGTGFKLAFVAALALLLLFPLAQIRSLLGERQQRHEEAVNEIAAAWGRHQTLVGPVLALPYRPGSRPLGSAAVPASAATSAVQTAYFLPESLDIDGELVPQERYRGIYRAILYSANLKVSGRFATPDPAALGVPPEAVLWDRAAVVVAVNDLRGVRENLALRWDGGTLPFEPASGLPFGEAGLSATFPLVPPAAGAAAEAGGHEFAFTLALDGNDSFLAAPLGKQSRMELSAAWKDPSFRGGLLPESRTISADGFAASWRTTWYGRDLPQRWTTEAAPPSLRERIDASLFGVALIDPVDHYHLVERAVKYGFLFITLAFAAFFLFEVLGRRAIHPFQYALIGGALCLFYLALLSLSEIVPFEAAYLAGAAGAVFLVAFYCAGVLGGLARGLKAGGALALVYAYLYIVLKMQDWSLVAGTAGLFVALFVLMALTRRVDWYARDAGAAPDRPGPSDAPGAPDA